MATELAHHPEANALGEHMSVISQNVYAAGWMIGTEWVLWRALLDWRETGRACWSPGAEFPDDITEFMPELDRLHRAARGWVWWMRGMEFVPADRWIALVACRESVPVWSRHNNAEIARACGLGVPDGR